MVSQCQIQLIFGQPHVIMVKYLLQLGPTLAMNLSNANHISCRAKAAEAAQRARQVDDYWARKQEAALNKARAERDLRGGQVGWDVSYCKRGGQVGWKIKHLEVEHQAREYSRTCLKRQLP